MEIYEQSGEMNSKQLNLFAEDSLASLTVLPGSEEARKMTVTSGLSIYALLENSDQLGFLGRMFRGSYHLDTVLSDLEGEGYTCWTFNIPACAVDAPHRRERIFVVAHSSRIRRGRGNNGDESWFSGSLQAEGSRSRKERRLVADTEREGLERWEETLRQKERWISNPGYSGKKVVSNGRNDWWSVEPNVGRVADGVPARVDRLRALGNAVVPQVMEYIGRNIMEAINET